MTTFRLLRPSTNCLRNLKPTTPPTRRTYSSSTELSPFAPRHFLTIADLTPAELTALVRNASSIKAAVKSGSTPPTIQNALTGQTIAIMMNKRSTRTRVSTESAVAHMGGHPMFLGGNDIQLGVNESLQDTSIVISSMVAGMIARVHEHEDITNLAKYSSVPVVNGLSVFYHPLQTLADYQTIAEALPSSSSPKNDSLGLEGMKIAWVGDANNVLFDLCIGATKLGCEIAVAAPKGYGIPDSMRDFINSCAPPSSPFNLAETHIPEEAIRNADVIVTDTWVSMGWEEETAERMRAFEGYQITEELAKRGGAREGWKFLHCLPRHPQEVSDEVFYSPRSLVFQEAENRVWSAIAALEGFVVNKGKIV